MINSEGQKNEGAVLRNLPNKNGRAYRYSSVFIIILCLNNTFSTFNCIVVGCKILRGLGLSFYKD